MPILGPSANFHGDKTPFAVSDLDLELVKQVDFVAQGVSSVKQQSTVVNCAVRPWRLIRNGAIKPMLK